MDDCTFIAGLLPAHYKIKLSQVGRAIRCTSAIGMDVVQARPVLQHIINYFGSRLFKITFVEAALHKDFVIIFNPPAPTLQQEIAAL